MVRKRAPATAAAIAQIQTEQVLIIIEERGGNSFRPNPVEIKVGDTITRIMNIAIFIELPLKQLKKIMMMYK